MSTEADGPCGSALSEGLGPNALAHERAADMLTAYAELIRRDGATRVEEHHYLPEVEAAATMLREPPPARDAHRGGDSYEASMLRNLLARIHRDGGHYVEQHGLDKALEDADAKVVAWLAPVTTEQVVAAVYAVGAEAARRGEMFPQTSDEQREDRHAVARVAEMLRWYERNTGCARLSGWPGA